MLTRTAALDCSWTFSFVVLTCAQSLVDARSANTDDALKVAVSNLMECTGCSWCDCLDAWHACRGDVNVAVEKLQNLREANEAVANSQDLDSFRAQWIAEMTSDKQVINTRPDSRAQTPPFAKEVDFPTGEFFEEHDLATLWGA